MLIQPPIVSQHAIEQHRKLEDCFPLSVKNDWIGLNWTGKKDLVSKETLALR